MKIEISKHRFFVRKYHFNILEYLLIKAQVTSDILQNCCRKIRIRDTVSRVFIQCIVVLFLYKMAKTRMRGMKSFACMMTWQQKSKKHKTFIQKIDKKTLASSTKIEKVAYCEQCHDVSRAQFEILLMAIEQI